MARLSLPTRDSLPDDVKERWDRTAARGPVLNIMRAFFINPAIETNAIQVWRACGLSPRSREIVILRAAFVHQSTYEWHQHVRIARDAGLTGDVIDAVRDWHGATVFSDDERALLAFVDEINQGRPSDASLDAVSKGRPDAEVFGILYLITLYFQLAHVMAALDLETEEPFVGWEVGTPAG